MSGSKLYVSPSRTSARAIANTARESSGVASRRATESFPISTSAGTVTPGSSLSNPARRGRDELSQLQELRRLRYSDEEIECQCERL